MTNEFTVFDVKVTRFDVGYMWFVVICMALGVSLYTYDRSCWWDVFGYGTRQQYSFGGGDSTPLYTQVYGQYPELKYIEIPLFLINSLMIMSLIIGPFVGEYRSKKHNRTITSLWYLVTFFAALLYLAFAYMIGNTYGPWNNS